MHDAVPPRGERSGVAAIERDAQALRQPMRKAHARFTGTPGTFAQFGDSITVTMAFWAPLQSKPKNMPSICALTASRSR